MLRGQPGHEEVGRGEGDAAVGDVRTAMQTQLEWLLVRELCTFERLEHRLGLKAKVPRTLIATEYSKLQSRWDEENGWVPFQSLHLILGSATLTMSMKKKLDPNSDTHTLVSPKPQRLSLFMVFDVQQKNAVRHVPLISWPDDRKGHDATSSVQRPPVSAAQ